MFPRLLGLHQSYFGTAIVKRYCVRFFTYTNYEYIRILHRKHCLRQLELIKVINIKISYPTNSNKKRISTIDGYSSN